LFAIQETVPRITHIAPTLPVNAMHFREWRKRWSSAEQIAMLSATTFNLTSGGDPQRVAGARVSSSLFPMLGIQPQLGRNFLEEEDQPGRDAVVILSDGLWERRFHRDPAILGQKILLNGVPREVVGVLPPGVQIPRQSHLYSLAGAPDFDPDIWKPLAISDNEMPPMGDFNYGGIARLKPGVKATQALDELNGIQAAIDSTLSERFNLRATITPLQRQMTGRSRQGLLLLLAAVGAVLLIICVKPGESVARPFHDSSTRARDSCGTRRRSSAAAGASASRKSAARDSWRGAGRYAGDGVAGCRDRRCAERVATRDGNSHRPAHASVRARHVDPMRHSIRPAPAWRSARTDPQEGLRGSSRSATDSRQGARVRSLLVSLEVALSTVCLVAAGLLLNSFVRLMNVDKGFDVERVLTANISLPVTHYPDLPQRYEFFRKAIERVRVLPGVIAAGVTNRIPVTGEGQQQCVHSGR
jgi:hypothetical protein